MKNRSELREIAMKVLYQVYIYNDAKIDYEIMDLIKEQLEIENDFLNDLVTNVVKNQEDISKKANKYLINWDIDRLNKVDKAILSIAVYELLYTKTPAVVVINEAIELSKKYSEEKVTKMINAALDKMYHEEASDE